MLHAVFHQVRDTIDVGFYYFYRVVDKEIWTGIACGMDDVIHGKIERDGLLHIVLHEAERAGPLRAEAGGKPLAAAAGGVNADAGAGRLVPALEHVHEEGADRSGGAGDQDGAAAQILQTDDALQRRVQIGEIGFAFQKVHGLPRQSFSQSERVACRRALKMSISSTVVSLMFFS